MERCPVCGKELTVENFKRDWLFMRWRCQSCGVALRRKYTAPLIILLTIASLFLIFSAFYRILVVPAVVLFAVGFIYNLKLPYVPHKDFLVIRTIFRGIKAIIKKVSGKTSNSEKEGDNRLFSSTCPVCKNKLHNDSTIWSRDNFQTQCNVCKTKLRKKKWQQLFLSSIPIACYFFNGRQMNKTLLIVVGVTALLGTIVSRWLPYYPFDGFDFVSVEEARRKWKSREDYWNKD